MDKGIAAALLLIAVIPTAVAAQNLRNSFFDGVLIEDRKTVLAQLTPFNENDFLRQSKMCEAATRLPWGDVNHYAWGDCIQQQRVRPLEEREADPNAPRTTWSSAVVKSPLYGTHDGCGVWSQKQPGDPPHMRERHLYYYNHAWNLCMEQHGIFSVPQGRKLRESTIPDYRAIAAEERTVTIWFGLGTSAVLDEHYYGCYTQNQEQEIDKAARASVPSLTTIGLENLRRQRSGGSWSPPARTVACGRSGTACK